MRTQEYADDTIRSSQHVLVYTYALFLLLIERFITTSELQGSTNRSI